MSLRKFYFDSIVRARLRHERYGQAMFNNLCEHKPILAEAVRGTEKDPFYCTSPNDQRFDAFIAYIESNWE
jgi:hypothetical protein